MTIDPASLPPPAFIDHDPATISARLLSAFETAMARQLQPGQPERLFIDWMAYQIALLRIEIQEAGEQNLLAFSRGAVLDHLGAYLGVARLAGEDDDRFRARIREAPETFSVAGPALAYRALVFGAATGIVDVAITQPRAGTVRVAVLTADGMPAPELLVSVRMVLSADKARPLSDTVEVVAPERVAWTLSAVVTLSDGVDQPTVKAAVNRAAAAYVTEQRRGLGRSLVPSQAITVMQAVPGVHSVELASPGLTVLDGHQWADGVVGNIDFAEKGESGD